MPISSKSRELVRLEHARASAELSKACQKDVERLRATLPRGGGMNQAIDDRQVERTRQSFNAWREAYVRAFEADGQTLTNADIEEITRQMQEAVRAQFQSRVELAPRSMTLGFREKLDQIVREQRQELVLAMRRMERDRAFPRKADVATNAYNISGPNARVNINSTDTSVNVVTVEATQLFGELRATIDREITSAAKRDELLQHVDAMEKTQGTPGFLQRYQGFIAALADHITLFQAFLPALLQLMR